jgi:hypothetical protein
MSTLAGQSRKLRFYPSLDRVAIGGDLEQLLDVPGILRSTGVELQKDEIGDRRHRYPHTVDFGDPGPRQDFPLPPALPDDQVNRLLPLDREANHTGERVLSVAALDMGLDWGV